MDEADEKRGRNKGESAQKAKIKDTVFSNSFAGVGCPSSFRRTCCADSSLHHTISIRVGGGGGLFRG